MVGFHNRFWGPVQVLNSYREQGKLGDVTHVRANYLRRRGVPGRGSWFTRKDVAGGGAVIDIGTHAIDLALYLMGYPAVDEVSATTRANFGPQEDYSYLYMWGEDRGTGNFDVEDSATAFIRCANGATISLEVAWAANREPSQDFFVRGTEAGAQFDISEDGMTLHETADDGVNHHRDVDIEDDGQGSTRYRTTALPPGRRRRQTAGNEHRRRGASKYRRSWTVSTGRARRVARLRSSDTDGCNPLPVVVVTGPTTTGKVTTVTMRRLLDRWYLAASRFSTEYSSGTNECSKA